MLSDEEILAEVKFDANANPMLLDWLRKISQATAKKILFTFSVLLTECPDKDNPSQCFYWLNDADWEQIQKELGGCPCPPLDKPQSLVVH